MIPVRDANPSGTRPVFTTLLIFSNVLVFIYQVTQPDARLGGLLLRYGLVPARITRFHLIPEANLVHHIIVPAFTSLFLHGGWMHLVGNMWYLWIFGDNVEDRLGHWRFLFFYLLCGAGAGAVHVLFNPGSEVPTIGASGAIAGVLGAYLLCFPLARVLILVPLLFFFQFVQLPAFVVLSFWFVLQFFSGILANTSPLSTRVAWWAHVGGFLVGIALVRLCPRCRRSRQRQYRTWFDRA